MANGRWKLTTMSALLAASSAAPAALPDPRTAAAVLAADVAWGDAEARGDAAFLDWLLSPSYRSVGPTGKATMKATIVAHARTRAGSQTAAVEIAAWKATHPLRGDVALFGDTAVLTWVSIKPSSGEPVSSSDIFVYRHGHWHPIYSQHTAAAA